MENQLSIIGLATGILGSLTGVASLIWLIYAHVTDRGRLRVTAMPVGLHDGNQVLTEIEFWCQVTNVGRRPIIVTSVDLHHQTGTFGLGGGGGELPVALAPGEYRTIKLPDNSTMMGAVSDVTARDSLGRVYRISRKNRRELTS